jgi:hypothetical protein
MKKILIASALAAASVAASAAPIAFTSTSAETSAAVIGAGGGDAKFASSPPSTLPLTSSTALFNATDFVAASALVAPGVLSTEAEADSAAGLSSANGSAEWDGTFVGASRMLLLSLILNNGDSAGPRTFASSTVSILLLRNGVPLFTDILSASGTYDRMLDLVFGATYDLTITANSEASTIAGGNAFASMLVSFSTLAVPEPPTVLLLLLPLAFVCFRLGRRASSARVLVVPAH